MMEFLTGKKVSGKFIKDLKKVSDLIFYDGPLLSHYTNISGDNYLYYWVDANSLVNRWLIFRVSNNELNKYLRAEISLLKVISEIPDKHLYYVDIDSSFDFSTLWFIELEDLPSSYLPAEDSFYKFKPKSNDSLFDSSLKFSASGLLEASFGDSPSVGYGTMFLDVLSPALHHLTEMSAGMGSSYYKYRQSNLTKTLNQNSRLNKAELISNSQFEVAGVLAGSFKLLLRPLNNQSALTGELTEVDRYCSFLLEFIEASFDYEKLLGFVSILDGNAITHYEKFLKTIQNNKLDFKLKWVNPNSNTRIQQRINYKQAQTIIENINRLEYQNPSELKLSGRFLEINLKTNHYTFISTDENATESRGYFDNLIKTGIVLVKFNQSYDVTISRVESKETGNKKPKIEDKLIAFYELS